MRMGPVRSPLRIFSTLMKQIWPTTQGLRDAFSRKVWNIPNEWWTLRKLPPQSCSVAVQVATHCHCMWFTNLLVCIQPGWREGLKTQDITAQKADGLIKFVFSIGSRNCSCVKSDIPLAQKFRFSAYEKDQTTRRYSKKEGQKRHK